MQQDSVRVIDIRGEHSPFTLLKIAQIFREMAAGDVLEIRQCDPETRSDLTRILPPEACRLTVEEAGEGRGGAGEAGLPEEKPCRIRLQKTLICGSYR